MNVNIHINKNGKIYSYERKMHLVLVPYCTISNISVNTRKCSICQHSAFLQQASIVINILVM